jgi:hypothetical protein
MPLPFTKLILKIAIFHQLLKVNRDWRSKWKLFCLNSSDNIQKNAIEALKKCNKDEFPTICSVENIIYLPYLLLLHLLKGVFQH